jgi:hypothetical protein
MTMAAKPKQGGGRPPGWRDVFNWALASAGATAGWFIALNHVFTVWDWYDPLEDFSLPLLGLLICGTLGLVIGIAQAFALPRVAATYRWPWFWRTALTLGGGFFVVFAADEIFNIPLLDGVDHYIRTVVSMTALALPLLWAQWRLLRQMSGASAWLWPVPNLLFLWVVLMPSMGGRGITLALLVWGFASGGLLVSLLGGASAKIDPYTSVEEIT